MCNSGRPVEPPRETGRCGTLARARVYDRRALLRARGPATGSGRSIPLPGGPDNLTVDEDGDLLAAVHPSLWTLALYRYRQLGVTRAPARVVEVPACAERSAGPREVYRDAGGQLSAATVALRAGGLMVIGAVAEDHLMVCTARR